MTLRQLGLETLYWVVAMDKELLDNYIAAIQAREIFDKLPTDILKTYCLRFEQLCLDDIKAQLGNPDITEAEILSIYNKQSKNKIPNWIIVAGEVGINAIKKHWPTATISSVLSAIVSFLVTWLQK